MVFETIQMIGDLELSMSEKQVVAVAEKFDYESYRYFYDQCEKALAEPDTKVIVMDFQRTRYMDSAALGMLVQIHKKAVVKNVSTRISNATGMVLDTLKIANMSKLYEFE